MSSLTTLTRSSAAVAALAGIPLALGAAALTLTSINPDAAYAMVVGRRLLAGERLYIDILETNPPLYYWLMSVPALLSRTARVADDRLVAGFTAALLLVAGFLAIRLLRLEPRPAPWLAASVVAAFVAGLTVPFLLWTGQREQIAAILSFPYALSAIRTASGADTPRGDRLWCGLFASLGFAIKPYFLFPWLAVEAVVVAARGVRSVLRAECVLIALAQAAYGLAIVLFARDYVTRVVPIAVATYWAYGTTLSALLQEPRVIVLAAPAAVAIALPWLLQSKTLAAHSASVFAATTLGWLIAYIGQLKGWYYHFLPAAAFGAAMCAAVAVALLEAIIAFSGRVARLPAMAVALVVSFGASSYIAPRVKWSARLAVLALRDPYPEPMRTLTRVVEEHAVGEPIFMLSTAMWPAFPLVNLAGSTWPYRYHFLWPLPALYRDGAAYRGPSAQGALEREFFETVVSDLVRSPPRLLIVERGNMLQAMDGRTFDFIAYFSASPDFTRLFEGYRRIGLFDRWEIYERP